MIEEKKEKNELHIPVYNCYRMQDFLKTLRWKAGGGRGGEKSHVGIRTFSEHQRRDPGIPGSRDGGEGKGKKRIITNDTAVLSKNQKMGDIRGEGTPQSENPLLPPSKNQGIPEVEGSGPP